MSIHMISSVLKHSEARLGDRLVLLVLADKANDDGTGAWPSVATIAEQARMSERAVRYSLRRLEAAGEIARTGVGPHGTTAYAVRTRGERNDLTVDDDEQLSRVQGAILAGADSAPGGNPGHEGGQSTTPDVSDFAPEPSLEPSKEPSSISSAVAAEAIRPDVDKLCHLLADLIRQRDPLAKVAPSSKRWRDACRLLLDVDGRSAAEVERVIRWSQADGFWHRQILSMPKLREKFSQLLANANGNGRLNGRGPSAEDFMAIARGEA